MSPRQNRAFTAAVATCALAAAACSRDLPTTTSEAMVPGSAPAARGAADDPWGTLSCGQHGRFTVVNQNSATLQLANTTSVFVVFFAQNPTTGEVLFDLGEPANKTIVECTLLVFASGNTFTLRGFFTPAR